MKTFYLLLIPLLFGLLPATARPATQVETRLGSFFHQITFGRNATRTQIRQWVSPIQVRLPVAGGNLGIQTALMYVEQTEPSVEEVWGALDTRFTGTWSLGKKALLSLHTTLPTGKRSLAPQDTALARILARNDLNFPVKTYGEGFDVGGAVSLAHQRGRLGFSLGLGLLRKGAYDPIQGISGYKPGDEASLTLGLDYTRKRFIYRLTAVGTLSFTDRLDGLVNFQNGKQLLLQASGQYGDARLRFTAEVTEIARLKNLEPTAGPGSGLLYELQNSNGNDLRVHLKASWTPGPYVTLFTSGNFKHLTPPSGASLYRGSAHLWEAGGGLAFSLGSRNHLVLRATRLDGSAESGAVQLSGFNLHGAFTLQY